MRSVRLGEVDFHVVPLNARTTLLRPAQPLGDESALPLLGQAILGRAPVGLSDVIATTAELCLVSDDDPRTLLATLAELPLRIEEPAPRHIQLPVCFEDPDGPSDWCEVERQTGLDRERYLARLETVRVRVSMYGFLPGFVYLSGLPRELRCSRKSTPSTRVEPGSVAVGGPWIGVYGLASPAGWQVLGRTPVPLVEIARTPPLTLRIGDRLTLRAISRQRFERLAENPPDLTQLISDD